MASRLADLSQASETSQPSPAEGTPPKNKKKKVPRIVHSTILYTINSMETQFVG